MILPSSRENNTINQQYNDDISDGHASSVIYEKAI